jgi:TonB family protein
MFGRNVVIAIVLTLIALAIAAYYFLGRSGGVKPSAPIGQSLSGETAPVDGSYAPMEAAEQSYVVSLSEKNGNFSTQVIPDSPPPPGSAVASLEDFRPVEEKAAKPAEKQGRSGKGTSGTVKNRASASEERESGGKAEPASPSVQISSPPQTPAGGSITEEARIIRLERPKFGDDSFAAGLEGLVVVQVEIDREGRPRQTRILRSTNDLLNAAVVEGVNKSEFSPRRTSEGAVNSWMTIPFTFRQKK